MKPVANWSSSLGAGLTCTVQYSTVQLVQPGGGAHRRGRGCRGRGHNEEEGGGGLQLQHREALLCSEHWAGAATGTLYRARAIMAGAKSNPDISMVTCLIFREVKRLHSVICL